MQPDSTSVNKGSEAWQAPEFVAHHHSASWYSFLAIGTVGVAAIVYLATTDYFGIIITILLGTIVAIAASHKPRMINYELSGSSLNVAGKPYALGLFKSFSVMDEGLLVSATLMPTKRFMPPLAIYLQDADADRVLDSLANRLPHDDSPPGAVDRLARRLRF